MAKKKQQSESEQMTEEQKNEKRVPFTRELKCALTREEVEERAQEAASVLERRDQREAELKEEAKRWKNVIAQLDVEFRMLSSEVRNKATTRSVECERVYDYDAKKVTEFRRDTGEVLHVRNMAESECQKDLDLGEDFV